MKVIATRGGRDGKDIRMLLGPLRIITAAGCVADRRTLLSRPDHHRWVQAARRGPAQPTAAVAAQRGAASTPWIPLGTLPGISCLGWCKTVGQ